MFQADGRPVHDLGHYLLTEIQHNIGKGAYEYTEVLSWAFEKIGIAHFSYVYVGYLPPEADKAVILGNYPKDWVKLYESHALYRKDPIINHSSKTSSAFFWEDSLRRDNESNQIFNMSAQYGIEQGFTVPVHEPGCAFGSMHLAASKENLEFEKVVQNYSYLISTISYIAHQQRPNLARLKPYQRLTEREAECLHWVAMGKSYGEIALILSISERTVKFHAQNIIKKLDSVNIKQAMTKALRMNLI
nr:LuxR family transcriptional regulator [Halomonas llamarensis]